MLIGRRVRPPAQLCQRIVVRVPAACSAQGHTILPFMGDLRVLRQWAGICDMTPDYSPIMGETGVAASYHDRLGHLGVQGHPGGRRAMAEPIATGPTPDRSVRARPLRPRPHPWPTRARQGPADAVDDLPELRRAPGRGVSVRRRVPVGARDHRPRCAATSTTSGCRTTSRAHAERWFHAAGCRRWLTLRRDTRTDEVLDP